MPLNTYDYKKIKEQYNGFDMPFIKLKVADADFDDNKSGLTISDVDIELSCGFEASVATFHIYNAFDRGKSCFMTDSVSRYIALGSPVDIALGYASSGRAVFKGFITKVDFVADGDNLPFVEVTAMDVKSIMMAETSAYQLKATDYAGAVREILNKPAYKSLLQSKAITKIAVSDTPDKKTSTGSSDKASALTIDMVNESDYEFIVRAAKRFNFEFFTEYGTVFFRKAKSVNTVLIDLNPDTALMTFRVSYDITGIVNTVETRAMDAGKGELINASKTSSNRITKGSYAANLIRGTKKVYIDPTVNSKQEAEYRVDSIVSDESYRFGSLEASLIGMPELLPGYFINFSGVGDTASNKFYLTTVHHRMQTGKGFTTSIEGKAAAIKGGLTGGFGGF